MLSDERRLVRGDERAHGLLVLATSASVGYEVFDGHDQRRVGDDAQFSVDDAHELCEGAHTVSGTGLRDHAFGTLQLLLVGGGALSIPNPLNSIVGAEMAVPRVHHRRIGRDAHAFAVPLNDLEVDGAALFVVELTITAGDLEAGGKTLHIPLPRARQSLVEVIDVEN